MIAPERAPLERLVEVDETYLGTRTRGGKRGRGAIKTPVMIGVELTDTYKPRRVRLERLERIDGAAALAFARRNIAPDATIRTDAASSYPVLATHGYQHWAVTVAHSDDDAHAAMPAVDRVFNRRRAGHVGLLFHRLRHHSSARALLHYPRRDPGER